MADVMTEMDDHVTAAAGDTEMPADHQCGDGTADNVPSTQPSRHSTDDLSRATDAEQLHRPPDASAHDTAGL